MSTSNENRTSSRNNSNANTTSPSPESSSSSNHATSSNANTSITNTNNFYCNNAVLPIGYRFLPTDEELVKIYLMKKRFNTPLPLHVIREIDIAQLYSQHPVDLVEKVEEKEWFFFVELNENYLHENRRRDRVITREKRQVWRALEPEEPVKNSEGQVLAFKMQWMLVTDDDCNQSTWRIEEFRIASDFDANSKNREWVVDKLIKDGGRDDLICNFD